ncbi:MAG: molybdopterin-dependent oxidoreductase [bacterium]|nr:molybdopterin-dependent oxidoreductase [bacterium]
MVTSNEYDLPKNKTATGWLGSGVTRRTFLKSTGALAVGAAVGSTFFRENRARAQNFGNPLLVETDESVEIKYSVCLACHSACGIRCKLVDGTLVKIDGNPYHPNCREEHLPFDTDPAEARLAPARVCAKGQAGIQVLYNPFRIKEPLKRKAGTARGAGEWETISWDQATQEIGDQLLALRKLDAETDPANPADPWLGPLANQVVFSGGRNEHGQKEFTDRFWGSGYGTINKRHDHTSICEVSHHVGYQFATGLGVAGKPKTKGATDLPNCEFVLWFGSDPLAANFPFIAQARKLVDMLNGDPAGKLAVVDPRCNVAASKADWWLPILPGTDAALALAIARYIIDNGLYNTTFLENTTQDAADADGELNLTDAPRLVKIVDGRATAYLRSDEAGLGGTADDFVVWSGGAAVQADAVAAGELLPGQQEVNGLTCKTAFEVYADQARSKTVAEWAAICEIDTATIEAVAAELTSHGRKASVEHYRGPVQHTNGTYTSWAIINLNTLIGNYNWKGGHIFTGKHWHETGGKDGNQYSPKNVTDGVSTGGVQITRINENYEDSQEYANKADGEKYPATRPWFPFASMFNYQEIVPSIEDQYPYACGALILYWNDIAYSTPAGRAAVERVLADEEKVPLIVSVDIEMGETTAFADYVLPDTTYLERWSTPHLAYAIATETSGVRQPVVGSFDGDMNYAPYLPNTKMLEDILIALGKHMSLPQDGADVDGNPIEMNNAWDWHKQLIGNIAGEGDGVPGADLDAKRDYVLARGGRFEDYAEAYDGEQMNHTFTDPIYFFNETLAKAIDSMTGASFDGHAKYEPIADLSGALVDETDAAYPLRLLTYKQAWHSMARTICNPWLVSVMPENFVEINAADARDLLGGVRTGDEVLVTSASHLEGSVGRAFVTETIRPGVVAIAHSFGHWQMSSKSHAVDGVAAEADETRGAGIAANPIMRADPVKPNVSLQDKIGGSSSFSDTRVQVAKV